MDIYLLRHLETANNQQGVYMGRGINAPILTSTTASYIRRLKSLNLHLASHTGLYSSPSGRCLQTLGIFAKTFDLHQKIVSDVSFQECDYGLFEGKTMLQIKQEFPREQKVWVTHPSKFIPPNGESLIQVQERAYRGLKHAISSGYEDLVICSHVDAIKMILFKILDIPIDKKRFLRVDCGSITSIHVTESKELIVGFINLLYLPRR